MNRQPEIMMINYKVDYMTKLIDFIN